MAGKQDFTTDPNEPTVYQIRLHGHLGPEWAAWFGGLTVTREESGATLLTGPVADQAALHGLLKKVRDVGLPLVSIIPMQPILADVPVCHKTDQAHSQQETSK